jgi:hypothetical protein
MLHFAALQILIMPMLLQKNQAFFKENFTNFYGMTTATQMYLVFQTKDKRQLALPISDNKTYFDAMENHGEAVGIPLHRD